MRLPAGICFSATSLGVWKKTMVSRKATATSKTAADRMPTLTAMNVARRCLRVMADRTGALSS
jgi:hypothetical protein